jgi:hypothetical protein
MGDAMFSPLPARRFVPPLVFGLACAALPPAQAHPTSVRLPTGRINGLPVLCADAGAEASLTKRETAILGGAHAEEHAQARLQRCRVLKGLEAEEAGPGAALVAAAALPPEQAGQWSETINVPVAGIASVVLNNGKVLFWAYDMAHWDDPNASNIGVSYLWNPTTRTGEYVQAPENIWCGGQTILADGRVFVAGGNLRFPDPNAPAGQRGWEGDASTYTYNPVSATFIKQPEMSHGRWYPTVTQLPDNSAIITSGYDEAGGEKVNQVVERFVPSAGRNGVGTITAIGTKKTPGLYPFQYVLPSGSMLQTGPEMINSYILDPASWQWTRLPNMLYDHGGNANGISYTDASVLPVRQMVVVAGGKVAPSNNEYLDGFDPVAGWRDYPKWIHQRHNSNTIILPDGKLLTVGGNTAAKSNYNGTLFSAELYSKPADDLTGTWTEVAPHTIQAAYHSSAILLPNATVLLSQDDRTKTVEAAANHKVQVYSPPYLFKGARPKMGAPATLARGQAFEITATPAAGRTIASAVLIAPGAVTHGNDMHQRFVKLPITVTDTSITATVPDSAALLPPGYYMLFIVDSEGVPSIAKFVHVG